MKASGSRQDSQSGSFQIWSTVTLFHHPHFFSCMTASSILPWSRVCLRFEDAMLYSQLCRGWAGSCMRRKKTISSASWLRWRSTYVPETLPMWLPCVSGTVTLLTHRRNTLSASGPKFASSEPTSGRSATSTDLTWHLTLYCQRLSSITYQPSCHLHTHRSHCILCPGWFSGCSTTLIALKLDRCYRGHIQWKDTSSRSTCTGETSPRCTTRTMSMALLHLSA